VTKDDVTESTIEEIARVLAAQSIKQAFHIVGPFGLLAGAIVLFEQCEVDGLGEKLSEQQKVVLRSVARQLRIVGEENEKEFFRDVPKTN